MQCLVMAGSRHRALSLVLSGAGMYARAQSTGISDHDVTQHSRKQPQWAGDTPPPPPKPLSDSPDVLMPSLYCLPAGQGYQRQGRQGPPVCGGAVISSPATAPGCHQGHVGQRPSPVQVRLVLRKKC